MAWLYMWVLAVPGVLLAGAPAAAASGTQQITDCTTEGSPSTSGTLAYAVAWGGTWTFACSGTGPFTIPIASTLIVGPGFTVTLLGVGQTVILDGDHASELFGVDSGSLTLDGLTLENGYGPSTGAILNSGTVTVSDSKFSGNSGAVGGAIWNLAGSTLTVSSSTFSSNSASQNGGAIFNGLSLSGSSSPPSTLTVTNSTFSSNSASTDGGAIWNDTGSTLTVTNSTFSGNEASGGVGGGGAIYSGGPWTVTNSTFNSNSASTQGGAIWNGDGGTPTVANSTFSGNTATYGGAISNGGSLTVSNSAFSSNSATSEGGAIWNATGGTLTVSNGTFSGNDATDGGAIFNGGSLTVSNATFSGNNASASGNNDGVGGAISNAGSLTVSDSTFSGNTSTYNGYGGAHGGAIFNGGSLTVSDSTFSGNTAPDGFGGAILLNGSSAKLTVSNSTFSGNGNNSGNTPKTLMGGAIANEGGTLTAYNSTFSGNTASALAGNLYGGGSLYNTIVASATSGENCFTASPPLGTFSGANDLEYGDMTCGSSFTLGNPQLGSLGDNGGPTQTMALGAGSAALGAGDPEYCDGSPVDGFDQRGVARGTTQATCDIGAYQATSAAGHLAAQYALQPSPDIAAPGSLSPGQTVAMTVYTESYPSGAKAPDVPVYLSLTGGTGSASVDGTALGPTPQTFTSDANGYVPVQYKAGTAPAEGGSDTLTVADAVYGPVALQATTGYDYPALVFTSAAQAVSVTSPASATLGPVTVALEGGGAPVDATSPLTVNLTSSSGTGVFSLTRGGAAVTSVTIPAGSSSAGFYYGDSAAGTPTLTASAPDVASGTQQETVVSADGSGSLSPPSGSVAAGSTGDSLTFTYKAASGGLSGGEVALTVPAGWSPPSTKPGSTGYTTATIGSTAPSVSIAGGGPVIEVTGVTLSGGGQLTITYADATAPTAVGPSAFTAQERSTAAGTLTPLASSAAVSVVAGTASVVSVNLSAPSVGPGGTVTVGGSVYDAHGDPVATTVDLSTSPAGEGSFTPASVTSDLYGQWSRVTYTAPTTRGSVTVVATAQGTSASGSAGLTVTPGTASKLVWTTEPGGAVAGAALGPQPVLALEDAYGNVETGDSTDTVTVALTSFGGATLSGTATVRLRDGVATFSGLSLAQAGSHTLTASTDAAGVPDSTSRGFTVTAGTASSVSVTPQSVSLPVNGTTTVSGAVYDSHGDPVPDPAVTLSATGGSLGTVSATVYGGYSATFTAPGTPGSVTVTASVYGGPSAQTMLLATPGGISAQPIAVSPGQASVTDLTATGGGGSGDVQVADYSGNPGGTPGFNAAGVYFDVALSAGNTFTSLDVERCGVSAGQGLYWWNGTVWAAVPSSPAPSHDGTTGCLSVTLTGSSSPSLAQLTATPFAVGTPVTGGSGGGYVATALVSGISPSEGPAAGGTVVTITGTGFTGATAVGFGPNAATDVTVVSGTEVRATAPAGSGTVDVTVTTPSGTSAATAGDRFTYQVAVSQTVPAAPAFSDVPPGYWAYADIAQLVGKGIVNGFPDGTFRPDAGVTRAQFVKMLVLTLGLKPSSAPTSFSDVSASAWYAPYASAAVRAGIVDGVSPTSFDPNGTLTREQMAVLVARALKLSRSATPRFTDDTTIDAWALQGVEEAVAAGYIDGFPNGSFQPLGTATRAQAAKVLAMVLQHMSS